MTDFNFERFSFHLGRFDFNALFTDVLGWSHPPTTERPWQTGEHKGIKFQQRMAAELSGVAVLEIVCESGWPDEITRMTLWRHLARAHYENLLIFLDCAAQPTHSLWYWVKRGKDADTGKPKFLARRHEYFRGQAADLFASKFKSLLVAMSELDERGRIPVLDVVRRMETALDIEKTTKHFYTGYQEQHEALLDQIEGIADARDRRWYASVILNRLMFVWFLQKKLFLDGGNEHYLTQKLGESRQRGPDRYFGEFLNALFFSAFAHSETQRSDEVKRLTGKIPYLNGGLFLHHKLELDDQHQPRIGTTLRIPDAAFDGVFNLFARFSWHLDDTPAASADDLNPDVLGYIFEKYINQKAFGAYYTRPEITGYLAERSLHKLILDRIREPALPELGFAAVDFDSVADLLARMDTRIALKLVNEVLPSLTVLDPAVGSGAFLVAALKTLLNVYAAVVGRAEVGTSAELAAWLKHIQHDHPSIGYYLKRRIVTDNLYGVDIMEEACEIAKLRLFLAMVASVRKVEELEPLPNIDFNILPGNSLVGLLDVQAEDFEASQPGHMGDLFRKTYRQVLDEKNRNIDHFRHTVSWAGGMDLTKLKTDIEKQKAEAQTTLNDLLLGQWNKAGIKFEQAGWDIAKDKEGKAAKRRLKIEDIEILHPFHWGFEFDAILNQKGGFDVILTNPPWEILKPQAKEFFAEYSDLVSKNKMTIKEFEKEQTKLLKNPEVRAAWLEYQSRFPHVSAWFRAAPQFKHQSAIVGGKKTGSDINLYKLFTEQCANLLRPGGECGIVIPSGIYTDLGAKGLRDLLFDENTVTGLFCFENRKTIFEGVDSRFKFVVLTFEKGGATERFPAAFMRHDVSELERFPGDDALWLNVALIRRLSPNSHSVMEFKSDHDVHIAQKMLKFPLLGERIKGAWNVAFTREFDMTNDSHLFKTEPDKERLPLYEGKMIHQLAADLAEPRYWVDRQEAEAELRSSRARTLRQRFKQLGIEDDATLDELVRADEIPLDHQRYRFGFRDIAASTNERSMICAVLPRAVFAGNTLNLLQPYIFDVVPAGWASSEALTDAEQLFAVGCFNGFVVDWLLRQKITSHLNMFYVYQTPVPRLTSDDPRFAPIVTRAARLTCTTPEFDALAKEAGLKPNPPQSPFSKGGGMNAEDAVPSFEKGGPRGIYAVMDPVERARLRAELDGLIAHLYGLTEAEFAHILTAFPLVAEPVKIAALNAYRDVARGLVK